MKNGVGLRGFEFVVIHHLRHKLGLMSPRGGPSSVNTEQQIAGISYDVHK